MASLLNVADRRHEGAGSAAAGVRVWLLVVAALVFLLVSIGGTTRLTGSGLSITEWQPIIGVIPPLSDADWQAAFAKYQQIPQYHHLNRGMSLADFKFIFWWEWTHRLLGRVVGLVFFLPFVYFIIAGKISRKLLPRLVGIFVLGGLQGLVGWYMVRSGLADRIDVSQYRLALHLALAILIFGLLIWVALSLDDASRVGRVSASPGTLAAAAIVVMVFMQVVLGGLVAGLRAGLAYNTWPLMDGQFVPSGLGVMQPWYLNLFENAAMVQFNHRVLAYALVAGAIGNAWWAHRSTVNPIAGRTALALAAAILIQAALGIWTLLAHVPLSLGLAHQAGAAAVFGIAVWHLHAARSA